MPNQGTLHFVVYFCTLLYAGSAVDGYYEVRSPCSCKFNGRVYNLAPLASSDGYPKFETDVKGQNFAYNPCIPFTIQTSTACKDVAICRWDNGQQTYTALGKQSGVLCQLEQGVEELVYPVPNKPSENTRILLKCNPKRKGLHDALFSVVDDKDGSTILEVEHYCCCPDACPLDQPTTGTPTPPTPPTPPVDHWKWVAVALSVIFGLGCVGFSVHACWRYHRRRRQDPVNQPLVHRVDENRPREN